eukprot:CAMPEP_0114455140 /NCGR_PEP_ID=MMETSP0104-20121206/2944_1 /TAXON_ID=37642 ORGANISM="Paraphysomonas imperforata, Strain PA2" /NCGR_SAMPLE_ID=MMETSP0104 /ASSEMBLY_ACC=CAM_ASM_000202 /LENGTH=1477 /DNA_ID=CAMNT_0001627547 /DNA_START=33 /DNA_END=4466 /DNA_ORIENTATION=+
MIGRVRSVWLVGWWGGECVLLALALAALATVTPSSPSAEFLALYSFYNHTNGPLWEQHCSANWRFGCLAEWNSAECPDPCNPLAFSGVSCSGSSVSSIVLPSCGLTGSLPEDALNDFFWLTILDVSSNNITGRVPAITRPLRFMQFQLGYNKFTGPIPVLHASMLSVFLKDNFLTGTLPDSLGDISSLVAFNVAYNRLQGTIPPGLVRSSTLEDIDLSENFLSGDLPAAIAPTMDNLNLRDNLLDGTIPVDLCAVPCDLNVLQLNSNNLHGHLPDSYVNMSRMSIMDVSQNWLTGTIPASVQQLSRLNTFILEENAFSGPLDRLLGMENLANLLAGSNLFTGPLALPPSLNYGFQVLNVSLNLLSGPFTIKYTEMGTMATIDASSNFLTGPLPTGLNVSSELRHVVLGNNLFTSSIPMEIAILMVNLYLDLSDNLLTGPIPDEMFQGCFTPMGGAECALSSVKFYLLLHKNYLTGTIPSSVGGARVMRQMLLFDNHLTGPIPASIKNMTILSTLLLQNNLLTGHPGEHFDMPTDASMANITFPNLQVVDIGDNRFSGSVPEEFFRLPRLRYFAITKGCYDGDLPHAICDASSLESLILEGLHAGVECNDVFWDPLGILNDAYISFVDPSTIPACVWDLPSLRTLHLAGNALTGTLPSTPSSAFDSLQDLSLSFNQMTGTIPRLVQEQGFTTLDLSRNRFSGRLDHLNVHGFEVAEALNEDYDFHIHINRLSGEVPETATYLQRLEILAGNIWSCDSENDLPKNDPQERRYVCGSSSFDNALSVWAVFFACVIVFGGVAYLMMVFYSRRPEQSPRRRNKSVWATHLSMRTSLDDGPPVSIDSSLTEEVSPVSAGSWLVHIVQQFQAWDEAACQTDKKLNPQLYLFLQSLINFRLIAVSLAVIIAVLYLPLYVFGKGYYDFGSHTPQYRWLFTAAYLSSTTAGGWMAGLFAIVLLYVVCQVYRHYFSMRKFFSRIEAEAGGHGQGPRGQTRRSTIFNAQAAISGKKFLTIFGLILFNCVFILMLKCGFVYLIHVDAVEPSLQTTLQFGLAIFDIFYNSIVLSRMVLTFPKLLSPSARIQVRLMGLVFNNILAPIAATAISDRSCFSELFFAEAGSIDTFSSIMVCDSLDEKGGCSSFTALMLSTTFDPIFSYDYQCSSSLFTVFFPVLLFSYTLTAFVEPAILLMLINFVKFEYVDGFLKLIPSILWPTRSRHDKFNKVILPEILCSSLLGNIAIILTFGVASPAVGLAVALSVYIYTWQWHYIVGRYLRVFQNRRTDQGESEGESEGESRLSSDSVSSQRQSAYSQDSQRQSSLTWGGSESRVTSVLQFHRALESACRDTWRGAMKSLWILIAISAMFMCMLLNDVSGDEVGIRRTLQVLTIPVSSLALALLVGIKAFSVWLRGVESDEMERLLSQNSPGTELDKRVELPPRNSGSDLRALSKSTSSIAPPVFSIIHATQPHVIDPHVKVLNEANDGL